MMKHFCSYKSALRMRPFCKYKSAFRMKCFCGYKSAFRMKCFSGYKSAFRMKCLCTYKSAFTMKRLCGYKSAFRITPFCSNKSTFWMKHFCSYKSTFRMKQFYLPSLFSHHISNKIWQMLRPPHVTKLKYVINKGMITEKTFTPTNPVLSQSTFMGIIRLPKLWQGWPPSILWISQDIKQ